MKIDRMYAFVAAESGPDDEGVCAFLEPRTGVWFPMVGDDLLRIESLRARAQELADASGAEIQILEFSVRKTIDIIRPADWTG